MTDETDVEQELLVDHQESTEAVPPGPGEPRREVVMSLPADLHIVGLEEVSSDRRPRWACYLKVKNPTGQLRRGEGDTVQEAIDAAERSLRETLARIASPVGTRSAPTPTSRADRGTETDEERRQRRKERRAARKARKEGSS